MFTVSLMTVTARQRARVGAAHDRVRRRAANLSSAPPGRSVVVVVVVVVVRRRDARAARTHFADDAHHDVATIDADANALRWCGAFNAQHAARNACNNNGSQSVLPAATTALCDLRRGVCASAATAARARRWLNS